MKIAPHPPPPQKSHTVFPSNPPLKAEVLSSPPFLKIWLGARTPPPPSFYRRRAGRVHTMSRFNITFLTILGVTKILFSFKLFIEGKTGKEIPESSKLKFLEKLLVAEDNTPEPLNEGGIADLPLLRTLLAICQKP